MDPLSCTLLDHIERAAQSTDALLLRGESGVGKGLVASVLHYLGPHPEEPLLRIDCAGVSQELLAHELFGSAGKGDPGVSPKPGYLELAGRGTVVLEEVAALSMPLQAKLLRVIERGEFERPGDPSVRFDGRILALTHVDLQRAVVRRSFREDLYYRLNVHPLSIAPLRERPRDIQPLAEHFLAHLVQVHRRPKLSFSDETLRILLAFSYPGNVRQLRNIVESAVVSSTGPEIQEDDLPSYVRQSNGHPLVSLEELERNHIADVLLATQGRKSKAAQILGISRKTLLEKRKRYGLE